MHCPIRLLTSESHRGLKDAVAGSDCAARGTVVEYCRFSGCKQRMRLLYVAYLTPDCRDNAADNAVARILDFFQLSIVVSTGR